MNQLATRPTDRVTVDLTVELLQETLIALRDREYSLSKEYAASMDPAVREIIRRQIARVVGCSAGIVDALEAATGVPA